MGKGKNNAPKDAKTKKATATTVKQVGIGRGKHLTFANYQWFVSTAQAITAKKRNGVPEDTEDQLATKVMAAWQSAHKKDGRAALATVDIIKEKLSLAKNGQLARPATKAMGRPQKPAGEKVKKSTGKGKGRPLTEKGEKKKARKQVSVDAERARIAYEQEQRPIREATAARRATNIQGGNDVITTIDNFMDTHRHFLPSHEATTSALYVRIAEALQAVPNPDHLRDPIDL